MSHYNLGNVYIFYIKPLCILNTEWVPVRKDYKHRSGGCGGTMGKNKKNNNKERIVLGLMKIDTNFFLKS